MEIKALLFLGVLSTILATVKGENFYFKLLSPRGFRVSTDNLPGTQQVWFRANINKEISRNTSADYSGDFILQSNNLWVYENPSLELNPGDVIYLRPSIVSRSSGARSFLTEFHVPTDVTTDIPNDSSTTVAPENNNDLGILLLLIAAAATMG